MGVSWKFTPLTSERIRGMAGKTDEIMEPVVDDSMPTDFEETTDIPTGRKSRVIEPVVWDKLADSAKRGVGFSRTGSKKTIDDLRKDLASAAVKAKYDVVTATRDLGKGTFKLTFSATVKTPE